MHRARFATPVLLCRQTPRALTQSTLGVFATVGHMHIQLRSTLWGQAENLFGETRLHSFCPNSCHSLLLLFNL